MSDDIKPDVIRIATPEQPFPVPPPASSLISFPSLPDTEAKPIPILPSTSQPTASPQKKEGEPNHQKMSTASPTNQNSFNLFISPITYPQFSPNNHSQHLQSPQPTQPTAESSNSQSFSQNSSDARQIGSDPWQKSFEHSQKPLTSPPSTSLTELTAPQTPQTHTRLPGHLPPSPFLSTGEHVPLSLSQIDPFLISGTPVPLNQDTLISSHSTLFSVGTSLSDRSRVQEHWPSTSPGTIVHRPAKEYKPKREGKKHRKSKARAKKEEDSDDLRGSTKLGFGGNHVDSITPRRSPFLHGMPGLPSLLEGSALLPFVSNTGEEMSFDPKRLPALPTKIKRADPTPTSPPPDCNSDDPFMDFKQDDSDDNLMDQSPDKKKRRTTTSKRELLQLQRDGEKKREEEIERRRMKKEKEREREALMGIGSFEGATIEDLMKMERAEWDNIIHWRELEKQYHISQIGKERSDPEPSESDQKQSEKLGFIEQERRRRSRAGDVKLGTYQFRRGKGNQKGVQVGNKLLRVRFVSTHLYDKLKTEARDAYVKTGHIPDRLCINPVNRSKIGKTLKFVPQTVQPPRLPLNPDSIFLNTAFFDIPATPPVPVETKSAVPTLATSETYKLIHQANLRKEDQRKTYIGPVVMHPAWSSENIHIGSDKMTIKGRVNDYVTALASHGAEDGVWFFEATILSEVQGTASSPLATPLTMSKEVDTMQSVSAYNDYQAKAKEIEAQTGFTRPPATPHVRIGWATHNVNLDSGLGFDRFGYGLDDVTGIVFHSGSPTLRSTIPGLDTSSLVSHAIQHPFFDPFYSPRPLFPGDVIGCLIHLPAASPEVSLREDELRSLHTTAARSSLYFCQETKEPTVPLPGSSISFFVNGVFLGIAAVDLEKGFYRPAVSIFGKGEVMMNFGPHFKHPPPHSFSLPRQICGNDEELRKRVEYTLEMERRAKWKVFQDLNRRETENPTIDPMARLAKRRLKEHKAKEEGEDTDFLSMFEESAEPEKPVSVIQKHLFILGKQFESVKLDTSEEDKEVDVEVLSPALRPFFEAPETFTTRDDLSLISPCTTQAPFIVSLFPPSPLPEEKSDDAFRRKVIRLIGKGESFLRPVLTLKKRSLVRQYFLTHILPKPQYPSPRVHNALIPALSSLESTGLLPINILHFAPVLHFDSRLGFIDKDVKKTKLGTSQPWKDDPMKRVDFLPLADIVEARKGLYCTATFTQPSTTPIPPSLPLSLPGAIEIDEDELKRRLNMENEYCDCPMCHKARESIQRGEILVQKQHHTLYPPGHSMHSRREDPSNPRAEDAPKFTNPFAPFPRQNNCLFDEETLLALSLIYQPPHRLVTLSWTAAKEMRFHKQPDLANNPTPVSSLVLNPEEQERNLLPTYTPTHGQSLPQADNVLSTMQLSSSPLPLLQVLNVAEEDGRENGAPRRPMKKSHKKFHRSKHAELTKLKAMKKVPKPMKPTPSPLPVESIVQ
ncbi:hypothetical protein BLNAU_11289 [Blattamonas nauphoetae]|uniref:SPRY domain-containing protein n=1 Tax=Blattamonas nauphoetae TaxID=2049346 RepID=A0ABQ9XQP3_9EUKA|nr:hypothetical protein BLNAU_11289 [Blattamonas nauphoetae]